MSREPTEAEIASLAEWVLARWRDQIEATAGPLVAQRAVGPRLARIQARNLLRRALGEPRPDDEPDVISLRRSFGDRPASALARAAVLPARKKPGPSLIISADEVVKKREELRAQDEPFGYDSVARALGVSPSTVRRRLAGLGDH